VGALMSQSSRHSAAERLKAALAKASLEMTWYKRIVPPNNEA